MRVHITHSWNYPFTEFLSDLLCTRTVPGCRERSALIMITPEYGVLTLWSTCCPTSGPGSSPGWWTATNVSWLTRLSPSTWTRGTASSGPAWAQTKYNFQLLSPLIISLALKVLFDPQFSSTGNNPWDHIILSLSKLHKQSPKKLERLQKSLDSALEMRRWGQTLANNWGGCRRHIILFVYRNNCRVRNKSLVISELVFMGASLGVCLVTIIMTLCKKVGLRDKKCDKTPRCHAVTRVLTSIINRWLWCTCPGWSSLGTRSRATCRSLWHFSLLQVHIKIKTGPVRYHNDITCHCSGYPYLIVLICVTKMIILKWVFVKVIRRQMIYCIEQREK